MLFGTVLSSISNQWVTSVNIKSSLLPVGNRTSIVVLIFQKKNVLKH
jgi:hypothetical protein